MSSIFIKVLLILSAAVVVKPQRGFAYEMPALILESPVFTQGGTIPDNYTCRGTNISPPLTWNNVPYVTKSLALLMDDPDAPKGTFTHWVAYNIAPGIKSFSDNVSAMGNDTVMIQGQNSSGGTGYTGPCPPQGNGLHRYFFKLFALDINSALPANASRADLEKVMEGHILSQAELVGRYEIKGNRP